MSENKRFEVVIFDNEAVDGYCVIDKDRPCHTCRLKYYMVLIGTEVTCMNLADLLNDLNDEIEFLKVDNNSFKDGAEKYSKLYHKTLQGNKKLKSDRDYWRTLAQSLAKKNGKGDFE